ncbi:L-ascorbate metabolism protein UlaG, beta-lactamase superfamily [Pseudonocardia thermophila]|mgnify:CR=1 FL=1|uniref:L-ascorbate metabolism protein UlaG, beta-lactamase superfamily n=1 Tax=Pseudonocardia thermophila TaxID=1848 RepID=A0A1M6SCQ0_PSETH|nr:MBL fold metallo-hydrolase [Pseudonocardia thermophila]SHK42446.1 L-ascorbate metabolism protein UlaG, beta-lactamase superfamily [Pseudonocardia thermophila]
MQITHYGHACLLLDTGAARLLIDPGTFATGFEELTGLDAILVTHQHYDHLDTERLRPLLDANPDARLIVDSGTAAGLDVPHEVTAPGATLEIAGARVEVLGGDHAVIHPDIPIIPNNAYLVDGTHLHPGDAFVVPPNPVDVLFVPSGAPWLKMSEAVEYTRTVKPRTIVPIHEAVWSMLQLPYNLLNNLKPEESTFTVLEREVPTTL